MVMRARDQLQNYYILCLAQFFLQQFMQNRGLSEKARKPLPGVQDRIKPSGLNVEWMEAEVDDFV